MAALDFDVEDYIDELSDSALIDEIQSRGLEGEFTSDQEYTYEETLDGCSDGDLLNEFMNRRLSSRTTDDHLANEAEIAMLLKKYDSALELLIKAQGEFFRPLLAYLGLKK